MTVDVFAVVISTAVVVTITTAATGTVGTDGLGDMLLLLSFGTGRICS
jgi:hypothetical protein